MLVLFAHVKAGGNSNEKNTSVGKRSDDKLLSCKLRCIFLFDCLHTCKTKSLINSLPWSLPHPIYIIEGDNYARTRFTLKFNNEVVKYRYRQKAKIMLESNNNNNINNYNVIWCVVCLVCFKSKINSLTNNAVQARGSQKTSKEMHSRKYSTVVDWTGNIKQLRQALHHTIMVFLFVHGLI